MQRFSTAVHIDSAHAGAICEEIGFHLDRLFKVEAELPARLRRLMERLREQEQVMAPSIVPSLEDMELLEVA